MAKAKADQKGEAFISRDVCLLGFRCHGANTPQDESAGFAAVSSVLFCSRRGLQATPCSSRPQAGMKRGVAGISPR